MVLTKKSMGLTYNGDVTKGSSVVIHQNNDR